MQTTTTINELKQAILNDDFMTVSTVMDTFNDFSSLNKEEIEYLKLLDFDVPEPEKVSVVQEVVSTVESEVVSASEQLDLVKYLYSENYVDTFLKPFAFKAKASKRIKSKPRFIRRRIVKLNKVQKEIYSIISKICEEPSFTKLEPETKIYILQLEKEHYISFSKFLYRVFSSIDDKAPRGAIIGKLTYKMPRLPIKDASSWIYEEVLTQSAANIVQILLNKRFCQSEPSRYVDRVTGQFSSVVWVYRPKTIKYNPKFEFNSYIEKDPYNIVIKGTTKSVSITSSMKKFIDKYTFHVNETIRFKRRPTELVDIYYGLLYYKENVSNSKSKESIFDLKDRLLGYRKNYDVIQNMTLDTMENKMYYDTRARMYSTITHSGFSLHGDKFESSNRECAEEYILELDDTRRFKSHTVQLLSDKKLSQAEAEPLYKPEMAKQLREPLTKFYKDLLLFSKWFRTNNPKFKSEDKFSMTIVREYCLYHKLDHKNLIRKYGKHVYMMELSKELSKKVGDKSRFLLKEDTTNMGILLSSLAFKNRKMASGTNILKGEGIVDTHQLNLNFINSHGYDYTRDNIKEIMSNPLNHGASVKSLARRLGIGYKTFVHFIIENYGISFLNFNRISSWIRDNYPNNGVVTWKLPDGFVVRSVAYAESQKLTLSVIDEPSIDKRDGYKYGRLKSVTLYRDMPILSIGSEMLNLSDKILRIMGGYANGDHAYEAFIMRKVVKIFIRINKTIFTTHDAYDMRGRDLFILERLLSKYFKKEINSEIGYYEDMCNQIAKQLNIEPPVLYEEEDKLSSKDIADIVRCIIP